MSFSSTGRTMPTHLWMEGYFLTYRPTRSFGIGALDGFLHEKWVSLEFALQTQLDKWESGKFYWDTDTRSLAVKRWIEADVTDALYAWDRLLLMIEAKLPQRRQKKVLRLEPLGIESMSSFRIGSFASEFLCRAPRPEFKHVAPGISTFSPETLYEIYWAEPTDSFRQTFNLAGPGTTLTE
ncbi:hypothetical protein V490_07470 [Pseudogymnoascus sp. VKM F-3557]|nr:hypothetical protein V490_07470 [Pseudogymnoascus sp. VKM F-3557]